MDTDERSRAIVLAHLPTYIKGDKWGVVWVVAEGRVDI